MPTFLPHSEKVSQPEATWIEPCVRIQTRALSLLVFFFFFIEIIFSFENGLNWILFRPVSFKSLRLSTFFDFLICTSIFRPSERHNLQSPFHVAIFYVFNIRLIFDSTNICANRRWCQSVYIPPSITKNIGFESRCWESRLYFPMRHARVF